MKLADFRDCSVWVGVDLAEKIDLAAAVPAAQRGREVFIPEPRFWCPEVRIYEKEFSHYAAWAADGHLTATEGAMIDQDVIYEELKAMHAECGGCGFAFDPRGAAMLMSRLMGDGIECIEIPQTTAHLSDPTDTVLGLVKDGRLWHDGNPILSYCVANVRAKRNAQGLVYPAKERPEKRTDGALALIMAVSRLEMPQQSQELTGELLAWA